MLQGRWLALLPRSLNRTSALEPSFAAEVEYRDITSEGLLLRQSSFKGLLSHLHFLYVSETNILRRR
jgi:hypothetical protein